MHNQWDLIESVCLDPDRHTAFGTFPEVLGFIEGLHQVSDCLHGFREWLVVHTDGDDALTWYALVMHVVCEKEKTPSANQSKRLFDLIDLFYDAHRRHIHHLAQDIFVPYNHWLEGKQLREAFRKGK